MRLEFLFDAEMRYTDLEVLRAPFAGQELVELQRRFDGWRSR